MRRLGGTTFFANLVLGLLWSIPASAQVPAAPSLIAPSGTGITPTPTYSWTAVDTATDYYLWVNGPSGTPVIQSWYAASTACNGTTCSATLGTTLARGAHIFWLQARNGAGDGPWSAAMAFTVGTSPAAPALVAPTGSGVVTTPTYSWNPTADTDEYYLWVNNAFGTPVIQSRHAAADICATTCSVAPATSLDLGSHAWWVQGRNASGDGPWSAPMGFVVGSAPSVPTLLAPNGEGVATSPAFSWTEVGGATEYELWVNGPTAALAIHETYAAASACSGGTCAASPSVVVQPGGYQWWVRGRNGSGDGSWSAALGFTVGTRPPTPSLIAPTGADAATLPTYTWALVPGATDYYLWVNGPLGTPVLQAWYAASAVCGGDQCSTTPSATLARGYHQWWVQARNASGDGPWSAALSFVVGAVPGTATLIAPTGIVGVALPTFVWTAVADTTDYYLWVNGPSGTPVIQATYASGAACSGERCVASPDTVLGNGAHEWWIQARNTSGDGAWSTATGFTAAAHGAIGAGSAASFAVTREGGAWSWGANANGALGDGTTDDRAVPTPIAAISRVTAVAAGEAHGIALENDGTVWTWGAGSRGQLGGGSLDDSPTPVQVPGLTDVIAVSAGWQTSLALKRDGTVWAWGANDSGQLGDGTQDDRSTPVQVSGLSGVTAISAGRRHGVALKNDGTVWAWGDNVDGQLGDGGADASFVPKQLPGLVGVIAVRTGSAAAHTMARTADGRVWTWGRNAAGELGLGTISDAERAPVEITTVSTVRDIAVGGGHTLVVAADGTVWSWGGNGAGQLGDGTAEDRPSPAQVAGLSDIVHVAAGADFSLALASDGTVHVWGNNALHQLGDGTTETALEPLAVSGPHFGWRVGASTFAPPGGTYSTEQTVVLASATPGATIAYTTNGDDPTESSPSVASGGTVVVSGPGTLKALAYIPGAPSSHITSATYAFKAATPVMSPPGGAYTGGQAVTLTTETAGAEIRYTIDGSEPTPSSSLYSGAMTVAAATVINARAFREGWSDSETASATYTIAGGGALAAGEHDSFALRPDGTLLAWGDNGVGELGDGTTVTRPVPVTVSGLDEVTAISTGWAHALALRTDGTVWAWGRNARGQLGLGTTENQATPVQVPGLTGIVAVSAGMEHSLALGVDGTIWAWGADNAGQLGDGMQVDRTFPTQVPGLDSVTAIAAGSAHSLARRSDGSVWVWGDNQYGELGDGTLENSLVPKPVPGLPSVDAIASGSGALHTFARTADGHWWGWGFDGAGQLGRGTTDPPYVLAPVELTSFAGVTSISAGSYHTLALKSDGTVWATGWNGSGQLGIGTTEAQLAPVPVASLGGVVHVAAGWYFSLALGADGTVYAWGDNGFYQLGTGNTESALSPIASSGPGFQWITATPTFSSPSGTYGIEQTVLITSTTPGATVHYTANGEDPTEADPEAPAEGVFVPTPTTLKARAYAAGRAPSGVASATYQFRVGTPAIDPPGGMYATPPIIRLRTETPEAEIHYTTDGSEPTADSPLYSGPLPPSPRIKAKAFRAGWPDSDVASAEYLRAMLAAGGQHSLALPPDGTVWAWGANDHGQLGTGSTDPSLSAVHLSGLDEVSEIAAGESFSLALRRDGTVWAWGDGSAGQMGDGSQDDRTAPAPVPGVTGIRAVAAGHRHVLALKDDGTIVAWGDNTSGQLGHGTTDATLVPVAVVGLTDVVAIAAGGCHSLAVKSDGTVWSWGCNESGQLGDDSYDPQSAPTQVPNLDEIVAVAAGASNSLALSSNQRLWEWGYRYGWDIYLSPTEVTGPWECGEGGCNAEPFEPVKMASAGGSHSLAVKGDGTAWAWGLNENGQLGRDPAVAGSQYPPIDVGLAEIASVAAGGTHSLALGRDGTVWVWGGNASGQLGDGNTDDQHSPEKIAEAGFNWTLPRPRLSVPAGEYQTELDVTVSVNDPDAVIHYTTTGIDPAEADPIVVSGGSIHVDASTTLKARAFKAGFTPSWTTVAAYVLRVPDPILTPPGDDYDTPQDVVVTVGIPGTTMHYTITSGESQAPTEDDPVVASGESIPMSGGRLWVRAFRPGWEPGNVMGDYRLAVLAPTITPPGGIYNTPQELTFSTSTPGATIHYRIGSGTPTVSDPIALPGFRLVVDRTMAVSAVAFRDDLQASRTTSYFYTLAPDPPRFIPPPGTYESPQLVSIVGAAPDMTIRYTLDGSDPTSASPIYELPIPIDATVTLNARAYLAGWSVGDAFGGEYVVTAGVATPQFAPAPGTYTTTQTVTVSCATADAVIHYTLDGEEPTESDPVIASGATVVLDRTMVLKARAWSADGSAQSVTRTGTYRISGAISLSVGRTSTTGFALALKSDGHVWAWGENAAGQLGNGGTTPSDTPVVIDGLEDVIAISAGGAHSLALRRDGTVWSWGDNTNGQLGDGSFVRRLSPVQVVGLTDVIAVSAGGVHSVALRSDGTVWTWGFGWWLGTGGTDDRNTPVHVTSYQMEDVIAISASDGHSQAVTRNGQLFGWGTNFWGNLGYVPNSSFDYYLFSPRWVSGFRPIPPLASVDGGAFFGYSLGLTQDGSGAGTVYAWGRGEEAHAIGGLNDVVAIDSPGLALRRNGEVWDVLADLRISIPEDVVGIASTQFFSAAVTSSGQVWTWVPGEIPVPAPDFDLTPSAEQDDVDGDGLTLSDELRFGTDPARADTNGDGVTDGMAIALGLSATNPDMDGDGLLNAAEIAGGTDPFRSDTDGDGTTDAADCFPRDPSLVCPAPDPEDVTPPTITILKPSGAVLVSSTP